MKRTHSQRIKKLTTTITNAEQKQWNEKYASHQCKLNACAIRSLTLAHAINISNLIWWKRHCGAVHHTNFC